MKPYFASPVIKKFSQITGAKLLMNSEQKHGGGLFLFPDGRRQFFLLTQTGFLNPMGSAGAVRYRSCGSFLIGHFGYQSAEGRVFPFHETHNASGAPPRTQEEVLDEARIYAAQLGWPVVLKTNRSRGSAFRTTRIARADDEFRIGCDEIFELEDNLFVQRFYQGNSYYCVVVDDRIGFAYQQPSLSASNLFPLSDVTDSVHPDISQLCVAVCRDLRLRVGGVRLITDDISRPLARYVILQVDRSPNFEAFSGIGALQQELAEALLLELLIKESQSSMGVTASSH